jgi:DNA-binding response OmpR family regulator
VNRILIAEDESRIASFIEKGLRATGMPTAVAEDGHQALEMASSGEFDLMVLDLGLPGRDGFSVLTQLRWDNASLPVIILTARNGVADTVAALEAGADDYVTKPFRFEELVARIKARLRPERIPEQTVLQVGHASLDLMTRRLAVKGRAMDLTSREFALAELFFRHPGQVLSRQQILDRIWGYDFEPDSNIVEVYVRYLRLKLGQGWIETVRGMGYRFESAPDYEVLPSRDP